MTDAEIAKALETLLAVVKNEQAQLWKALYELHDAFRKYEATKGDKR